jgi:hypothetical protein
MKIPKLGNLRNVALKIINMFRKSSITFSYVTYVKSLSVRVIQPQFLKYDGSDNEGNRIIDFSCDLSQSYLKYPWIDRLMKKEYIDICV